MQGWCRIDLYGIRIGQGKIVLSAQRDVIRPGRDLLAAQRAVRIGVEIEGNVTAEAILRLRSMRLQPAEAPPRRRVPVQCNMLAPRGPQVRKEQGSLSL